MIMFVVNVYHYLDFSIQKPLSLCLKSYGITCISQKTLQVMPTELASLKTSTEIIVIHIKLRLLCFKGLVTERMCCWPLCKQSQQKEAKKHHIILIPVPLKKGLSFFKANYWKNKYLTTSFKQSIITWCHMLTCQGTQYFHNTTLCPPSASFKY